MCSMRVLVLLTLLVQLAHSFSWDIVVSEEKTLKFYYNETITHAEYIPWAHFITSVTYDPVHYRVLFADENNGNVSIFSFEPSTREIQPLGPSEFRGSNYLRIVYDPVTELLLWKTAAKIYSFSLKPASSNKAVHKNLLFRLDDMCGDIAVDSCGGYIYWVTDYNIERARFDGSEREVLIDSHVRFRRNLAIDQQTQKIYWSETKFDNNQQSIECADFNGKNRTTLYNITRKNTFTNSLTVSKDFLYWKNPNYVGIWQLPKIPSQHVDEKIFSMSRTNCMHCHRMAVNYTIKEQTRGTKNCEALKSLIPYDLKPDTVSICENYCFQGDCSVSAEGQPTCSCKAGYSGDKCEVNVCHEPCLNNVTGVHTENTTPQVLPDQRNELRQVIKEELKRMLQFFSDKIVEYQAKI